jgi:hypothetical protein
MEFLIEPMEMGAGLDPMDAIEELFNLCGNGHCIIPPPNPVPEEPVD